MCIRDSVERVLRHGGGAVNGAAFSSDGRRIATAGENGEARLWSVDGGLLRVLAGHQAPVNSVAFSPDGGSLVTASNDSDARVWDLRSRVLRVRVLRGHSAVVSDASFSPDGRWIVTAGPVTVGVWEADPDRRIDERGPFRFLRGHASRVRSARAMRLGSWRQSWQM